MPLWSRTRCSFSGAPLPNRIPAAEAGDDRTCPVECFAQFTREWRTVKRRRSVKTLGRHNQCELAAHAEPGDADAAGAFRQGVEVIAGSQHIVQRPSPFGQHFADDLGDASRPAAPGEQIRRQRDVSGRSDMAVDRFFVRSVAHSVMNHDHARPGALAVGDVEQGIDRAGRGVDLDCRHEAI